ncbi:MAG: hypothetical protein FJX77_06445, partial [Armatimonadetes bacterium]|nr:hypothetical protein [Armatimonadota bacterium]
MRTSLLLLLALPPALALSAPAAPPAPAAALAGPPPEQVQFFETKIRPLLVERCQGCHGGKQQQGGLRLDSGAVLRKGGSRGLAVLAADPERSLL